MALIDTAGRLQTQHNLMEELRKVRGGGREGRRPARPTRCCWCSTPRPGQNGLSQARLFDEAADLTGVVLTKVDGTARGGIAVAIRRELGIPVKLVGSGEKLEDLQPFDAQAFARAIFSTEDVGPLRLRECRRSPHVRRAHRQAAGDLLRPEGPGKLTDPTSTRRCAPSACRCSRPTSACRW